MVAVAAQPLDPVGKFIARSPSIQNADRVPGLQQGLDDVPSHKLAAAKDKDLHGPNPTGRRGQTKGMTRTCSRRFDSPRRDGLHVVQLAESIGRRHQLLVELHFGR